MTIQTISAQEFARRHPQGLHMLDVRTPAEYHGLHVEGAVLCPLTDLDSHALQSDLRARGFQPGDTLYLLCQGGRRAQSAAEKLAAETVLRLVVVEGGTQACVQAGLPTRTGASRVISLERQVRIVAGAFVFSGVLLGFFVAQPWFALSGFVGAGLMFAGISDTCAMGMLLARMPWNSRVAASCAVK